LGPQNKDHVNISDNKPICIRLQTCKFIEIWVLITSVSYKRNTNVEHISKENTFTNL
jgi:hypothetical protein